MTRGRMLSEQERAQIDVLHREGLSQRAIGLRLKRSHKVIGKYLKEGRQYRTNFRGSRNTKLSNTQVRAIVREASKTGSSASSIRNSLQLNVGTRRVQQIMSASPNLKYKKARSAPPLSQLHIKRRLNWARIRHAWTPGNWGCVVFSDEKRFNLDGPDGFHYYWHDLRKEEKCLSRRQNCGGSVMIWGCFSEMGIGSLAFTTSRINAVKYMDILRSHLLPFIHEKHPGSWTFQQDNAPVHTAKRTKEWLNSKNITVMDWPARSPDLNPIENMWGILARAVYRDCRQFETIESLKQCISTEWSKIDQQTCYNLSRSMTDRCAKVLEAQGKKIDY